MARRRERARRAHRRDPGTRSRRAGDRVRAALVHVGRARRPTVDVAWPLRSPVPGTRVGVLLRNRPVPVGAPARRAARRRAASSRSTRSAASSAPARDLASLDLAVLAGEPDDLERLVDADGRREHRGAALDDRGHRRRATRRAWHDPSPRAGRRGADADERHHRSAEAHRPHVRDARARPASAPSTTSRTATRSLRLRTGVVVVNSPIVHLGGLFRVLQCVNDGRSFALLERFTVDAWIDAVRRHRPRTVSLVPAALRMVLDADLDPGRPRSVRSVVSGTAPLVPDDAEAFTAQVRRAGARLVRRDRVRRRRRGLEPRRPPAVLARRSAAASAARTPGCELRVVDPERRPRARSPTRKACSR